MQLFNGTYLDKLETIDAAQLEDDGDTITLVGRDGIKRIACKMTSTGIQYRLLNPDDIKGDSKTAAFSLSDGGGDLMFAAVEDDIPTQLTKRVTRAGSRIVADWLEAIQEVILGSGDIGQIGDRLLELYPQLPSGDLAKLVDQASTVAGMAGYYEASQQGT
jgi:hypothetical protein